MLQLCWTETFSVNFRYSTRRGHRSHTKQVRLNYIFLSIRCREHSMPSAQAEVIALAKGLALEIKPSFLSSNRFELEAPAHMISAQSWPLLSNIHLSNSSRSTLPRPLFSLIVPRLLNSVAMGIKLSCDTRGRRRACWSIKSELLGKHFFCTLGFISLAGS